MLVVEMQIGEYVVVLGFLGFLGYLAYLTIRQQQIPTSYSYVPLPISLGKNK